MHYDALKSRFNLQGRGKVSGSADVSPVKNVFNFYESSKTLIFANDYLKISLKTKAAPQTRSPETLTKSIVCLEKKWSSTLMEI